MSDTKLSNPLPRAARPSQIMDGAVADRFGFTHQQSTVWFDVSIFYVRVSSCPLEDTPEELTMVYPPRDISTVLEVNGGRIAPAEQLRLVLRRDRLDTEASEAMYVSTDKFRATGTVSFEVYDKEDILLSGRLGRTDSSVGFEGQGGSEKAAAGARPKSAKTEWRMDLNCAITSPRSSILKGRQEFSNNALCPPAMEVCVVGRFAGLSVALTETVQLSARRKLARRSNLDAIVEGDEREPSASDQPEDVPEQGSTDREFAHQADKALARLGNGYESDFPMDGVIKGYVENEDGDLSWFNAGFRVGVGIGLGMCLGMGIGVGLLVRTARTVRRNLF